MVKTIVISLGTLIRRTRLAAVMLGCVVLLMPGTLRANQFDTLRIYWQNQLTGTNLSASTLTGYASTATNYWNTINTNPSLTYLWSDLPLGSSSAYMSTTFGRLQSLALAWATTNCPLQTNAALGTVITNAMNWMCAKVYTTNATEYFNWWDWEIGSLQALNNIVVLMYPMLTPSQITNYNNSVDYYGPNKLTGGPGIAPNNGWMTGANLTDQCKGIIIRAITGQDTNKMSKAQTNLSPVFLYVTNSDGFYRDGSFIQHTTHPYTGGYGATVLSDVAQLVNLLNGSIWQITDPNLTNVFNWVFQTYEPVIYNGEWMAMVCGRAISRGPASSSSASFVNPVAQFAPVATAAAILGWSHSPSLPPSQYQFAGMDRVVAWRSNFCAGLSMSSSRISTYESGNGEDLHGWFTGDGMLYLYLGNPDTQFTSDFWPTVDAYHLPGTTVEQFARANSAGQSQLTGQPWVGGAQVALQYGTAGMSLAAYGTTLTAKKSWFMFDNNIVCLGAGITCGDGSEVDTTVENRRLGTSPNNNFTVNGVANPPVMGWNSNLTSATWCALDGVAGYYFPGGATNLRAAFVTNTGSWSQINDGSHIAADPNFYTDDYLTLWFNHGIKPTNSTYAYVILPNYTASGMAAYAASPDIVVLTNTATIQAASKPGLGVVAAHFWVDGTNSADLIKANKKSAVITLETAQGISVGIADPTQTNSGTVSVTLNRSAVLTAAADPGVTVVQLSPQIILSVNVSGSLGKTYQASFFYSPVTLTWDADTTMANAQDGSGNWDNPGANWWDGTSDISWNDTIASIAVFGAGGTAGTVTLTNAHTAVALAFNPVGSGAYTLAGTGLLTVSNGITVNASATVGVPLNLPASQTWTVASNQTLNVTGTISAPGTVSLSLAGGGTLAWSGPNTNNGLVTVNTGTLLVNGNSLACTNTVTVSSNAILGGTGTNGGSVVLNVGGQLAPGGLSSVGTLTLTNNLTLNGSTLFFALATNAPTTNDLVAIGNRLTVNGANSVILSVSSMIPAGNYTLMTFAGGYTGTGTFTLGGSMTNNASLQLNANSLVLQVGTGGIYVFTDTWKGYASGTWNTSALNWTNGSPIVPYQDNDAVIFDDTLARNSIISNTTPGAVVSPGSMTFNNNLTNYTIKANIGGTNLLIKSGTATVALTGTNTYTGNTTINGGTLVVTNGGTINSPLATLNIGAQAGAAGTLTLSNSAITVQSLLATNVTCGGPTNSVFNFIGGTLVTSNGTGSGYASAVLLASNASWIINGNWTMNGGTNLISNVATNSNPTAYVYVGGGTNNVQVNVNPNAVWWLAIPTNSLATNDLTLVIGSGNATNNALVVNNGTLIVTNTYGANISICIGNTAGSAGNQLIITNGGQVFTKVQGSGGPQCGNIGNSTGPNNSLIVVGTNAAGRKAMWNLGADRLNLGIGNGSNNWALVGQGGMITNVTIFTYGNYSSLFITNGGQIFALSCVVGRSGFNSKLAVAGVDAAGNSATLAFPTAGTLTVGGGTGTPTSPAPGTNNLALVGLGGLVTNAASVNVGQDTNSVRNMLVITNGGQVFSTGNSAIGYVTGCNSNSVTVGGGAGVSLWNLGNRSLAIGNNANATNNSFTLFAGGVLTNISSLILGGVNSRLNFNGGTLAAGTNGSLMTTTNTTVNANSYVQSGGAIINDNGYTVINQLPLLPDPNSPGGGLTKLGGGTLTLTNLNLYTGPTFVGAGTLALSGGGSIAGGANITVAGGATFDVSALSTPFSLGAGQTLSNSTVGAGIAGANDCSAGIVSLVYDGTNPSFFVTNGTLTLAGNTGFKFNNTGPTLPLGSYEIIANVMAGNAGWITGAVPTNVTFAGASLAGAPTFQILLGGLYLGVGGKSSAIGYNPTTFLYNGAAQSPTITFVGSTGTRTTNFVGVAPTSYGPSVNAPTNAGTYYVSNTVAVDANYYAATNGTAFTILPRAVATVSFSATNAGSVINPAFCGLSYEKSNLTRSLFTSNNVSLIGMFGQIAPAVLRIGGNTVDTTCWGGVSNLTAITAAQVDAFAGFVKALPTNWHVIYGINLSVNNPTNCAAEAAYAANALGSSLLGFEIGNECDLYAGNGIRATNYTYTNFLPQWRALAAAIANTVPGWAITNGGNGWTLTGPVSASNTAGYTLPFATNEAGVISLLSQHYYKASGLTNTMQFLLQPDPTLPGTVSNLVLAANVNHLPLGFRMAECNTFYYTTNPVSSQYGAALWTLDYMFTLALNGCQGVNFHGGGGGSSYNTFTPIADNGTAVVMARSEFYGMKLFSLAGQGGALPAAVSLDTNINFTAYGVWQAAGVIGAVLNNKDTNYTVQVTINLGSNVAAASSMVLTGPDLSSSNSYTLGGAVINPDGSWAGGFQSVISATNGQLTITVPPITAVWLSPIIEDTNTLLANDAAGTSSFTGSTNWTDGLAPHAYSSYYTSTNLLLSSTTGAGLAFAGDSLTIGPSVPGNPSFRLVFNAPGGACTVNNCILAGSIIDAGVANATNYLSGNYWLVTASSSFGLGGDNTRAFILTNLNLSGTSALSNGVADGGLGTMVYVGNAVNFTGPVVTSFGTTLQAYSQTNLGGNPASFNADQLVLDNGSFQPLASMALTNANSGVMLNPGGGTFNVTSGLTLTIGNPITGPGNLTNSGGGQLTLTGTNTYTGSTTINAGTLAIGGAGSLGNGNYAGNLINNGAFNYTSTAAQTLSGAISGPGTMTISAGTLLVNGNASAATGTWTVSGGAILAGTVTIGGNVVVNAGGGLAPANAATLGTMTLTNSLTLNGGTLFMDIGNVAGSCDLVNVGGTLVKSGANIIALSFANGMAPAGTNILMSFSSATGSGTFALAVPYANVLLAVTTTNVMLVVSNGGAYAGNLLTWKGYATANWDDAVNKNWTNSILGVGANFNPGDNVVFDDTLVGNSTITTTNPLATVSPGSISINNSLTNYAINANIGGTGAFVKLGSAAVTLAGSNNFSGGMTLSGGGLNLNHAYALGTNIFTINGGTINTTTGVAISNANNNAMFWNSNFAYGGSANMNLGTGLVTLNGTNVLITGTSNTLIVCGNINLGNHGLAHAGGGGFAPYGIISGTGSVTNTGGFMYLTNNLNSYTGITSLTGGTNYFTSIGMVGGGSSSLGAPTTASNGVIYLGGTLRYISTNPCTSDRVINGGGTFFNDNGGTLLLTGGITNGTGGDVFRGNAGNIVENGLISGGGFIGRTDTGTLTLTNALNTYTNYTYISYGTIVVDTLANSGVPCSLGTGPFLILGQINAGVGVLQFVGTNGTTCNRTIYLENSITPTDGGAISNMVAGSTITFSGNVLVGAGQQTGVGTVTNNSQTMFYLGGVGNGVIAGIMGDGGVAYTNNKLAVTKTGSGMWTLTGANTNRGPVAVNGGTLLINGDSSGATNTVTVASGVTFGGSGTNGGNVVLNGGAKLALGGLNTIGTLTLTNHLNLNGNTLYYDLGNVAGVSDLVAVSNTLYLTNVNTIVLNFPQGSVPAGTNTLMTFANGYTGPGGFVLQSGYANVSLTLNANNLQLVVGAGGTYAASSETWRGNVNGTWDINTTANWMTNGVAATYADGNVVQFDDTLAGSSVVSNTTPGAVVSPGSVLFNDSAINYLVSANMSGPGGIAKSGSGTVTLAGANTYASSTVINAGTVVVTNGGSIYSPNATLNIGATAGSAGTNTLLAGGIITVKTLLATNVVNATANSVFNFNGGTLTTSNSNGSAANLLLASNATWNVNGNWNLNGGTNIISNVSTNSGGGGVYVGNNVNNVVVSVNSNAVWLHLMATSFVGNPVTNNLQLVIGNQQATNNQFVVNGGTLIATNAIVGPNGGNSEIIIANGANCVGNQLIVTNGGQVISRIRGDTGGQAILLSSGNNNSMVVMGANAAGVKSTVNLMSDRINWGGISNWVAVGAGGMITNCNPIMSGNYAALYVTNGGLMSVNNMSIGRGGNFIAVSNIVVAVGGTDGSGNKAMITSASGNANGYGIAVGGGSVSVNNPGANCLLRIDAGGVATNAAQVAVGGISTLYDSNCPLNTLIITNGGQLFSSGAATVGLMQGCNANQVSLGGGLGASLWNLGGNTLTIGANGASNNLVSLFPGGGLTNFSAIIMGGANSRLNFNGGTLAAAGNGNLMATNSTAVNAINYVQSGGAIIDSVTYTVTNVVPFAQDPGSPGGGLAKLGGGTLMLLGVNTYTGPTLVSAGTLALSAGASIANSANITVAGGAIFNVSGLSSAFTLGGGQTLSNSAVGATVNCGANGFSTASGALSLVFDGVNPSFNITNGTLTLSGTTSFQVNNTGSPLVVSNYLLIATNAGSVSSVAGAVPLSVTVNGGGTAGINSLVISNHLLYLVVASSVNLSRTNLAFTVSGGGTTLNLSWPADHLGWTLQTNSLGLANTNDWFPYPGSTSLTNVIIPIDPRQPAVFYRLMHP